MSEHMEKRKFELIVTIVEKDMSADVLDAARRGGAEGGTVLHGRGSGVHERAKFFGIVIEPEKEIILTLVDSEIRSKVVKQIAKDIDINKPGNGILFVLDVSKVVGVHHLNLLGDDDDDGQ